MLVVDCPKRMLIDCWAFWFPWLSLRYIPAAMMILGETLHLGTEKILAGQQI